MKYTVQYRVTEKRKACNKDLQGTWQMFRSLSVGWLSKTVLWEETLYAHHGGARPSWSRGEKDVACVLNPSHAWVFTESLTTFWSVDVHQVKAVLNWQRFPGPLLDRWRTFLIPNFLEYDKKINDVESEGKRGLREGLLSQTQIKVKYSHFPLNLFPKIYVHWVFLCVCVCVSSYKYSFMRTRIRL